MQVTVPSYFYDDHADRCSEGVVVKRTKREVTVELDREEYEDLYTDAEHYSHEREYWEFDRGLVLSARATLRRLKSGPGFPRSPQSDG